MRNLVEQASSLLLTGVLPSLPLRELEARKAGRMPAPLFCLTLPMLLFFCAIVWVMHGDVTQLMLLLPGLVSLPVLALASSLKGKTVPLSQLPDAPQSVGRGLKHDSQKSSQLHAANILQIANDTRHFILHLPL